MDQVRIYLVGGSNLFRHGLRSYLDGGAFQITGEVENYADVAGTISRRENPDLILYAKANPEDDAAEAVRVMRETGYALPSLYRETSEGGLAKAFRERVQKI